MVQSFPCKYEPILERNNLKIKIGSFYKESVACSTSPLLCVGWLNFFSKDPMEKKNDILLMLVCPRTSRKRFKKSQ